MPQGTEYWIARITAEGYESDTATVKATETLTNHYEFPTFVLRHAGTTFTNYIGFDRTVTIPDTINGLPVTSIGAKAFLNNYLLTSVTIGTNVYRIGGEAFRGCSSLTNITIPDSVGRIDGAAFLSCASLTAITVNGGNSAYSSSDGVLFDKNKTTLIQFPAGKGGSYTIPDSVTSIEGGAFSDCHDLTGVKIPDSVTSIGYGAFSVCTSLTDVRTGNGLTAILNSTFTGCKQLAEVTIGNHVRSIQSYAFAGCPLNSLTIPDSVTDLETMAFYGPGPASVTIGNGTTNIAGRAFGGNGRLTAITVAADNPAYSSLDGVLFDKNQTTLLKYPDGIGGDYTIPNGVTSIGTNAFFTCILTGVTIPDSVTNIADGAFDVCIYLDSVKLGKNINLIERNAFEHCSSLTEIYFYGDAPKITGTLFRGARSATIYYLPGSTGWGDTFDGRPTKLWNQ